MRLHMSQRPFFPLFSNAPFLLPSPPLFSNDPLLLPSPPLLSNAPFLLPSPPLQRHLSGAQRAQSREPHRWTPETAGWGSSPAYTHSSFNVSLIQAGRPSDHEWT